MKEELLIRKSTLDDIENVFNLSNDDIVRRNSINQKKIKWEDHIKWFQSTLEDVDILFYVSYYKTTFIGYCILKKDSYDEWVISIHINPNERLKGYGKQILKFVCSKHNEKKLTAYVKINNRNSFSLFKNSGFNNDSIKILNNIKCYKFTYINSRYVVVLNNNLYNIENIYKRKDFYFIKRKEDLTFERLKTINPKYVFFIHWSYVIPEKIYENFNCVLFHMTDLPFGRGGSPLQNLIERGIYKTKISAIKCVKEIDAGGIYLKKDFDISKGSAQEIYAKAGEVIVSMIEEIIEKNPMPIEQSGEVVKFRRRNAAQSNMENLNDINKIYDYIRMLDAEGYPKAFINKNDVIYRFYNAKYINGRILAEVEIQKDYEK